MSVCQNGGMAEHVLSRGGDAESSRRWLMKALREASGEMYELLMQALRGSSEDAEALTERAWRAQTIAAWQIGHILFQSAEEIPLHDDEWLERTSVPDCYEQLREWYGLREQVLGVLYMLGGSEWEQGARHRFQGDLTVESVVRSLHRGDLEVLNRLRAELEVY